MSTNPELVRAAFAVAAPAYDRLMGRYLPTLAPAFLDAAGIRAGMSVLDVGCGPGGLTAELVARLGAPAVAAIDPSPPFVAACRARNPGVEVREGVAEELPWPDEEFDGALASLVVGFLQRPAEGVREMARVTRPGGVVAACAWDHLRMPTLHVFWSCVSALDPTQPAEQRRFGATEGDIGDLFRRAGLDAVEESALTCRAPYEDFEDWWAPFAEGVGPGGVYVAHLSEDQRTALRSACHERLGSPAGPFELESTAWFARARVPG